MTYEQALKHSGIKAKAIGEFDNEFVGETKSGKWFKLTKSCYGINNNWILEIDGLPRTTRIIWRNAVKKIKAN